MSLFFKWKKKSGTSPPERKSGQAGSIFTVLLAGIAMASALSLVLYQTISGPMSSMVRVTNKTSAKATMQSVANIVIMNAVNNNTAPYVNGDCDADGSVEPIQWRSGAGPTGGGLIPLTIGAPITDPWGTDYGYCVWDVGATRTKCAGAATNMRVGTSTPAASPAMANTVIAIISAGPNRTFSTTCSDYVNDTTDVITTTGDDIVLRYTYQQAAGALDSLWSLKTSTPTTATIGTKNIEVGSSLAAVPTSVSSNTSGLIHALALTTDGRISSCGAVSVGQSTIVAGFCSTATTSCVAGNTGDLRYNTVTKNLEVCDGTAWNATYTNDGASSGGGGRLDLITSATASQTSGMDSLANTIVWNWTGLTGTALTLASTSTAAAAAQTVLNVSTTGLSGTNALTTYGLKVANTHTNATSGTNVGLYASASNATTANYAAIFANGNVGIGTTTPGTALEVVGAIRLSGTGVDTFTTPLGFTMSSKLNIPLYDPGAFGQEIAMGLPATANASARAISMLDARTVAHQPTLTVFSPDENQAFGLSWDGANTVAYLKSSVGLSLEVNGLTTATDALHILTNGNVGIGTPTPTNPNLTGKALLVSDSVSGGLPTIAVQTLDTTGGAFFEAMNNGSQSLTFGTYSSANVGAAVFGVARANNSFIYTNPASAVAMGTLGAQNLTFGTNSAANVTIQSGGYVGIGTPTPATTLDVSTTATTLANIEANVANNGIAIDSLYGTGVNYAPGLSWYTTDNNPTLSKTGIWSRMTGTGSYLQMGTSATYASGLTNTALTIGPSGNVGIGTATPIAKLDISRTISGTVTTNGTTTLAGSSTLFKTQLVAGESIQVNDATNEVRTISSITDDTHLVVSAAFTTSTVGLVVTPTNFLVESGNVGIGTTTPVSSLQVATGGLFSVTGTLSAGPTLPAGLTGAGTRMFFYPNKAAFRAGYVDGTQWDDASVAFYSTAMGRYTTASATSSTAMGESTTASGTSSTAMGTSTTASGYDSTAMGYYTTAAAYLDVALGRYNVGGGTSASWVATEPLFEIGNGVSGTPANAVTVLKNGNVGIGTATPNSTLQVAGSFATAVIAKSAPYTLTASDNTVNVSGATTITLPSAVGITGRQYTIKKTDVAGTSVTIGGTVDGTANRTLTAQYQAMTVVSDGTNWYATAGGAAGGGGGGSAAISGLTVATAANTIDNVAWAQNWSWNSLVAGNGLNLTSTSTAATASTITQTLLNVALSGANANTTVTSYGAQISNTHTGTLSTNVGIYGLASGGASNNFGVYGSATGNGSVGVYGTNTGSGYGGYFTSSTGYSLITGTGNVGIGTTTPVSALDVRGSAGITSFTGTAKLGTAIGGGTSYLGGGSSDYSGIDFYNAGVGTTPIARIGAYAVTAVGSYLQFGTTNTWASGITNTAMTINPSGYVGIGTAVPVLPLDVNVNSVFGLSSSSAHSIDASIVTLLGANTAPVMSVSNNVAAVNYMAIAVGNNAASAAYWSAKTRALSTAPTTAVQNNDYLLSFVGTGANGTSYQVAGAFGVEVDGVPSATSMPGRLTFSTTPSGTNASVQRMVINNQGNVGIGTKTPANDLSIATSTAQYSTGTASQSTTTITGSGTTFTSGMVGETMVFANGVSAPITGYTSATVLTSSVSQTVASQTFNIYDPGLEVTSAGNVGIGTAAPVSSLQVATGGLFSVTGTYGAGPTLPAGLTGAGARMLFYPNKAAFRAGVVYTTEWDDVNIGYASVAMGNAPIASGNYSTAMGSSTTASGSFSTAMGNGTTASGNFSTAMESNTTASGSSATAMGYFTTASGDYSTAMGGYTTAQAFEDVALGQYNIGGGTLLSWVATDPLFEIGIGTSGTHANAVTVLKNGNVGIGTATPKNSLSVASTTIQYNTGTASQATTTITGVGTTFTAAMVGSRFVFANGVTETIAAYTSATSITASVSQTVASQAYTIYWPSLEAASNGYIGVGTVSPAALFDITRAAVADAPGLTGTYLNIGTSTFTDNATAASGTAANNAISAIGAQTLAATNTLVTTTNAYSLYLGGAPIKGTNNTATNAIALGIAAAAVGAQTNSYGLYLNAQTGATNNYAATFIGGNVGIATAAPTEVLDVTGNIRVSNAVKFVPVAGNAPTYSPLGVTAMGSCTTASITVSTSAAAQTCSGVPASASVAVSCSGAAAFTTSGTTTVYARANGTGSSITMNTTAANSVAMTYTCMWMQP